MTRSVLLVALLLVPSACQNEPAPAPRPMISVNGRPASGNAQIPGTIDQALKSDPCAARLHAVSGAMLQYYALNRRLPRSLDELVPLRDPLDPPLSFTCPATNAPYVYTPAGLVSREDARQIILHDAAPDRAGMRWAIMMQKPAGRQPAAMWVVSLTDPLFHAYEPAPARPATTAPATRP